MANSHKKDLIFPSVEDIVTYVCAVAETEYRSEEVLTVATGLIGDIANTYRDKVKWICSKREIKQLIQDATQSEEAAENAKWVQSIFRKF